MKVERALIPGKLTPGHAVHRERHEQTVPVDRCILVELVADGDADPLDLP